MKLTDRVYLVGSGQYGFSMTCDYDSHVYLIDGDGELALIDAGVGLEQELILERIEAEGLKPRDISQIFLTHAHSDHAGGAEQLIQATGARVYLSELEVDYLRRGDEKAVALDVARAAGLYPSWYRLRACPEAEGLAEQQKVRVGQCELTPILVPGHSEGSLCYLMVADGRTYLFSGDVVFWQGMISLLNCRGSSLEDYRQNIGKLAGLGVDVLLPGHASIALSQGQRHIDAALRAFKGLVPPPNLL